MLSWIIFTFCCFFILPWIFRDLVLHQRPQHLQPLLDWGSQRRLALLPTRSAWHSNLPYYHQSSTASVWRLCHGSHARRCNWVASFGSHLLLSAIRLCESSLDVKSWASGCSYRRQHVRVRGHHLEITQHLASCLCEYSRWSSVQVDHGTPKPCSRPSFWSD